MAKDDYQFVSVLAGCAASSRQESKEEPAAALEGDIALSLSLREQDVADNPLLWRRVLESPHAYFQLINESADVEPGSSLYCGLFYCKTDASTGSGTGSS